MIQILDKIGNTKEAGTLQILSSNQLNTTGIYWGELLGTLSNQTDLQAALNSKQNTLILTTTGNSGPSTLIGDTLNIPEYLGMIYPGAGIPISTGSAWSTSRIIVGPQSVVVTNGDGILGNPSLALANDVTTPLAFQTYGMGAAKGWFYPSLFESTGVLSGFALSINGGDNTKFNIAAGIAGFVDYSISVINPPRTIVNFAGLTAQTVTGIGIQLVTYVGINNAGTVVQQASPFTNTQRRTIAQIGVLVHTNLTNLNAVNDTAATPRSGINQLYDLINAIGTLNTSGNVISPNGANLNINKSAGTVFKLGSNFQNNPLDPHISSLAVLIAPTNIRYRLSNGTEYANTAVIDPGNYESSPGVLSALSNPNRFSVQRVSIFTSNLIRIQYGQTEYISLAAAEEAINTQSFTVESNIAENGIVLGYIILRRSTTDLTNTVDAKFIQVSKFGAAASSGAALTSTAIIAALGYTPEVSGAATALLTTTITDGDTTHAPNADVVFDALALKSKLGGATRNKWHIGNGNGTGVGTVGWTIGAIGTATAANVATTNRHTQSPGIEYLVTVASTSAIAGWRETATQNFMGSSAGDGGFRFLCRFGPATGVSTATTRSFTGMMSSAVAQTDVEPSTLLNMFGAGWDAADANIQFMHNDGSGTATKIDLGIAVPTVDRTSLYELIMTCEPNSTTVNYSFADLQQGGTVATGSVSTNLPAANTLLASRGSISVGGTNSVIGYALKSVWVESNF